MKVLILGSSFDSLLAAHAASMSGHDVKIFAEEGPIEFESGPNLLLQAIPLIDTRSMKLRFESANDPDVFMDKLVNQSGKGKGPEGFEPSLLNGQAIYNSQDALLQLADTYVEYIQPVKNLGGREALGLEQDLVPDFTFSGVERDELCVNREHAFQAAAIVTMQVPTNVGPSDAFLSFNGDPDVAWAMEWKTFGETYRAYGAGKQPPVSANRLGGFIIPQGHNCDCNPLIHNVGRLGAWDHAWRRHTSFYGPMAKLGLA